MFLFKLVCACKKILSINILFSPKKLGSESCSDQQSFSNNFVWINTICVRNFFAVRWGAVDITKSLSSDVNCVCLLSLCDYIWFHLLAPQSGALRISAYRDFQSNPTHTHTHTQSTYSFRAFKPFYSDQKQCK